MELSAIRSAYAKVNPALRITGVKEGYHVIDTLLLRVPMCDTAAVTLSDGSAPDTVEYSDGSAYTDDRVLRALNILREREAVTGSFSVKIEKRIPSGRGLGASSAAAAAAVAAVSDMTGRRFSEKTWALIGADARFQVSGMPAARAGGAGEILSEWLPSRQLYIAFACASGARSDTAKVFAAYDVLGGAGGSVDDFISDYMPFNALETAAAAINPLILTARRALTDAGYERVVMTGSGAGYIGFTFDKAVHAECLKKLAAASKNEVEIYDFQGSVYG